MIMIPGPEDREHPQVSIVIVNFNGKVLLRRCLASIFAVTAYPKFEVVLVDNASTDGSVELVKELFGSSPNLRIIENQGNLGHAEGCNIGARKARGEYLVFLDSDTEVKDARGLTSDVCPGGDWLTELVKVMENDASIGLAQAKIVLAEDHRLLDHVGMALDALGTWHTAYGLEEKEFREVFEVLAASSGGCITRRDIFREAGGFDPDYFIYDDDTDLSLRTRLLGYRVVFVPSAVIAHHAGPARGLNPRRLYHGTKNRLCTMLKGYELKGLWWRLLAFSLLMVMLSLGLLLLGKIDQAMGIVKGLFYPLRNLRKIWVKRLLIQSKRRVGDTELMNQGFLRKDIRSTIGDIRLKYVYF